ncbi:MAG: hypothetical protein RLZZ297_1740 [Chloroflexota bacterium]|jgi:hypothetical protein
MRLMVTGDIFEWRGPAPFLFVAVPDDVCGDIRAAARLVSYGWGVIPATCRLDVTTWTTSLFPKNGGYLIPIKKIVQTAQRVTAGDVVTIELLIGEEA